MQNNNQFQTNPVWFYILDIVMDISRILVFDLELTKKNQLRHLGAILGNQTLDTTGSSISKALTQLDQLSQHCDFIMGHNILHHDLPWISQQKIPLKHFLSKPVIDTLLISPLAFPANPYHRLIKDYKLVKDSLNDPVADSRITLQIFKEQMQALAKRFESLPELLMFFTLVFFHNRFAYSWPLGIHTALENIIGKNITETLLTTDHTSELNRLITIISQHKVCPNQLNKLIQHKLSHKQNLLPMAYIAAWLQVCGNNSVLPPWVWRQFPQTLDILQQLREQHCRQVDCRFCQENHDAKQQLNKIFNLADFRNLPDGTPLQKQIIETGMSNSPLLGILPTGGGKSLCFQLPAIIRNQRNSSLSIVISPLQALMKDQVDNLKKKIGISSVGALYGMLTMPERGALLEDIRLGDIALLYLSPEQLRNPSVINTLSQRHIGAWIFDEAHCLSKWGHDFRPDYLYTSRIIKQLATQQGVAIPPVFCFTATAKPDVIADICNYFSKQLQQDLQIFKGGVERDNLSYQVREIHNLSKTAQILQLLDEYFGDGQTGSCVIYCSTRSAVEKLTAQLKEQQPLTVASFHAGLENTIKRETLETFIAGEIRVICATNAFGMGIDKEDVRLVIHSDIPGSLENYLQEAGRAGRDRQPADCILLFDEDSIEQQFKLSALNEIKIRDIQQILRGIRSKVKDDKTLTTTTGELLRMEQVETDFDAQDNHADTKVKTAVAWLERAGFVQRNENCNRVFQGKVLCHNLDEAIKKIDRLHLGEATKTKWLCILSYVLNADIDEGISADLIAEQIGHTLRDNPQFTHINNSEIMKTLAQMSDAGLLSNGLQMTTWFTPKGKKNARKHLKKIVELEQRLIQQVRELSPDDQETATNSDNWFETSLNHLNQYLLDSGYQYCNPDILRRLLKCWETDGRTSGQQGSVKLTFISRSRYKIQLNRSWNEINKIIEQRQEFTTETLDFLYCLLSDEFQAYQKPVFIGFALEDLISHFKTNENITSFINTEQDVNNKLINAAERSLLFLHELGIIQLQSGLAVFSQAMTMDLIQEPGKKYTASHYEPLSKHYTQRTIQIHIMYEYAKRGIEKMRAALRLLEDYFTLENNSFINRYFADRKQILEKATSEQSFKDIVDNLQNPYQQEIVTSSIKKDLLILAGPGSGKSKVIIHRCAYLLRVKRIKAGSLLVLCFNHNAAISLRKRLYELLGQEARTIRVCTFHGLAMQLTGHNLFNDRKSNTRQYKEFDFNQLLLEANLLLQGKKELLGIEQESLRDSLLEGIEHLLVDEYQDIDEQQYQMIAALSGKFSTDDEQRLTLMVVGDDDQSIYGFRHANVKYIRQFQKTYEADIHYLTQNYRSTKAIIRAANSLISHNQDRMKNDHDIEINEFRQMELDGGRLQVLDTFTQGKVLKIPVQSATQQAAILVEMLQTFSVQDPEFQWKNVAILARNGVDKQELREVRAALMTANIPCGFTLDRNYNFPVYGCREIILCKKWLKQHHNTLKTVDEIKQQMLTLLADTNWKQTIIQLMDDWQLQIGELSLSCQEYLDLLNEYLTEQSRSIRYGEGILLSTVHGVKGEEFSYVFILDGGWQLNTLSKTVIEEERRTYYVGMTRAIEQLILFQLTNRDNPHIQLLSEQTQYYHPQLPSFNYPSRQYQILGMQQLYISYAAKFPQNHPIHQTLAIIESGDKVHLEQSGKYIVIKYQQQIIARLSNEGIKLIAATLTDIESATIIAMIHKQSDPDNELEQNNKVEEWYLPIIEIEFNSYG